MRKYIFFIIAVVVIIFAVKIIPFVGKVSPVLFQYISQKTIQLKKSGDSVNILLLGVGGGTHEGPDLTDTIIFASLNEKNKNVAMLSIPRDLWVADLSGKVNTAYVIGNEKQKGRGLTLARAVVSKIVGKQINYVLVVNFDGFVKAVNLVGGLDVVVTNTFDDYAYPITGQEDNTCGHADNEIASLSAQIASGSASDLDIFPCRYKHIHFDKGIQHMDGETALEYVRSRHALGSEGSDFARSKRQQAVITAFKNKIFSAQTFLNPAKVVDLYTILAGSIDTDIKQDEIDDFIRLTQNLKNGKITSGVLDTGNEENNYQGLLINPPISPEFENAWVLIPRAGTSDYSQIQNYLNCELNEKTCITPTPSVVSNTSAKPTK